MVFVLEHPQALIGLAVGVFIVYNAGWALYQIFLSPLAKYPGPLLAKVTDLWQVHEFLSLKQPYNLTALHEKHGSIVRYGPDKLSITDEAAISIIYQKGGRAFPKTEFYDAYGGGIPNVFGMRNEDQHAIRRRHMAHSFSSAYVQQMEEYLDLNIRLLSDKIAAFVASGQPFDLKKVLHYYAIDVLGELAFSQSFGVQVSDNATLVPPVVEHSLLAAATGAWPAMLPTLKRWLSLVPLESMKKLFAGRQTCIDLASCCVDRRRKELGGILKHNAVDKEALKAQRRDILTSLMLARHPDTGEMLSDADIKAEAFGFIIAGTHTTSATTALLLYHLLQNPATLEKCIREIDSNLSALGPEESAYPMRTAESSLPYLRNCIRENFRLTPVFTMPLARRVTATQGVTIGCHHFPQGTSLAICNHAFHHDPAVWGPDHQVFRPERWDDSDVAAKVKLLMHFGLGGRQCVGKNVAMASIWKVMSTLLRLFEFEIADEEKRDEAGKGSFKGVLPSMVSVGISELERPLIVRARVRAKVNED